MDDLEEFAGEIGLVAVREMAAVAEVHRQHLVAGLEHGEIDGHVRAGAGVRLHVGVLGPEELLGAVNGELFDLVHVFAPAVPAFLGVTFRVLVREHGALGFHDGGAGEIFRGDELDVFLLAAAFGFDVVGHGEVHVVQAQGGRREAHVHLVHAAFVAAAFEGGGDERVQNLLAAGGGVLLAGEADDIDVVVLAAEGGAGGIANEGGADAGDLVGGNAHAHAAAANEQAEFGAAIGHGFRHGQGEVGIVIGGVVGGRAEILDGQSLLLQVFYESLLQFEAAVIRADGESHGRRLGGNTSQNVILFHKFQQGDNPLVDLVTAIFIHIKRTADGIADVFFKLLQRVVEFAEHKGFFRRPGIHPVDGIHVAVGHAEDEIGLPDEVGGEGAAALIRDVHAHFEHGHDGMRRGRLAIHGPDAGRVHLEIPAPARGMTEYTFRHGAAADISGANKKDRFH